MRIAIVGAGAIGCWMGGRFAACGHEVSVLARGATLRAVTASGLRVTEAGKTQSWSVTASDKVSALGPQDIIIIAVKAPSLSAVASSVASLLEPQTLVVPAINGVPWWFGAGLGPAESAVRDLMDPGGAIAAAIPSQHVIGCVVYGSAATAAPGHASHQGGGRVILGEPAAQKSERLAALAQVFADAGFNTSVSAAIRWDVWYKLLGNMTMNPISAITGASSTPILADSDIRALILAVIAEAGETGARIGCVIDEPPEARIEVTKSLGDFRTSMLQDAQAGRPIELEALLGAPRAIAAALGVATPYTDILYGLTRLFGRTHGLLP